MREARFEARQAATASEKARVLERERVIERKART